VAVRRRVLVLFDLLLIKFQLKNILHLHDTSQTTFDANNKGESMLLYSAMPSPFDFTSVLRFTQKQNYPFERRLMGRQQ